MGNLLFYWFLWTVERECDWISTPRMEDLHRTGLYRSRLSRSSSSRPPSPCDSMASDNQSEVLVQANQQAEVIKVGCTEWLVWSMFLYCVCRLLPTTRISLSLSLSLSLSNRLLTLVSADRKRGSRLLVPHKTGLLACWVKFTIAY